MCGIAGVLFRDALRPVEPAVLKAMADAIAHRGPDAEGFWTAPGVGLAHRRLSIVDLEGGRQPLTNEDGSIVVVFNGEIYNHQVLRRWLESRGHHFRTKSDTEVLVHLYEEEGQQLVHRLRGMFAFALWDGRQRRLLLARDRVGLKPLYVYRDSDKLLFGSELKAILAHSAVDRTLNVEALESYLAFGVVPGRQAIFRRVDKVPAGHLLTITADNLQGSLQRYWTLQFEPDTTRSAEQWCEAIRAKIDETVQVHRMADVPLGAFLSGGLDSSAMVASLAASGNVTVPTFSIGFQEDGYSELPSAREVARHFGTQHVEQIVTAEAVSSLDDLVQYYDEPFADSSAIPTLLLSRLARQHVKVVLSGDGGDEAFGGYTRYTHDLREDRWRNAIPSWMRRRLCGPLGVVWPKADFLPRGLRVKNTLINLSLDPAAAYANTVSLCRWPLRRQLLSADVRAALNGHRPDRFVQDAFEAGTGSARDPLGRMLAADVGLLLPDDFLTKVDRASMACGLEVRPPLVDHELLELAASIPSHYKVRDGQTKWIFKQAVSNRLPQRIVQRPKQGFEVPIDAWLRGPLREMFEANVLAAASPIADYVSQSTARQLYRSHLRRTGRHGNTLWSLLVLARWLDRHLTTSPIVTN